MAAIARRRLELLSNELAGLRTNLATAPEHGEALPDEEGVATAPPAVTGPPTARNAGGDQWGQPVPPDPDGSGWDEPAGLGLTSTGRGRHAMPSVAAGDRVVGWLHDRLPPTLQGRVRLTSGHLSVVALLVAACFAVTAWWVVRAGGSEAVAPAASWSDSVRRADVSPSALVSPAVDNATATASASEAAVVVVDVTGKVRRPGIATLPAGSRVVDALEAAGGVRRGVDVTSLNLARVLVDGEQIVVGIRAPGGVAAPAAAVPGVAGASSAAPMVNINSATQAELEELPGVGPVTAAAILKWRSDNGPFTAVDDLLEVSGIGDATLAEMAPFVTL